LRTSQLQPYKTKYQKAGFCNDRVHVVCRRKTKDNTYPLDTIVYDFEWLARYVLERRLQAYLHQDVREDIVQHMMMLAIKQAGKYPYQNLMGSKEPAFAYFSTVMFHAGLDYLTRYRKAWKIGEQSPDEDLPDVPVQDQLPPMFIAEKMSKLIENSRKEWFHNDADDTRLRELLEKTAATSEIIRLKGKTRISRLYQAIVMMTLDPEEFPRADDEDGDVFFRALELLVGKRKAQQACFLWLMLEGNIRFNPG
jgi:DNA-directed RNA polymerase specialized sigma24 family protein